LVESFDEITTLSKPLREKISEDLDFFQLKLINEKVSSD
jgi:adenine C2-methylase RlmN of 23S rRNA A2503 and tRNA A37